MDTLIKKALLFAILVGMPTFCGCGGGGDDVVIPATTKGTAKMVFSTGLPAGSTEQFGSVQLVFELPTGVTVSAATDGNIPTGVGGVLKLSGEAMKFAAQPNASPPYFAAKYTPATPTSKATVNMEVLVPPLVTQNNVFGMNPGEFVTLTCELVPDVTIDLNAFRSISAEIASIGKVLLYDTLGGVTGPAAAGYSVTLQYPTAMTGATSGSGSF